MDADFIQTVARVGDVLEVGLASGQAYEGVLEELTLQRLLLRRNDGRPVVLLLSNIVMASPGSPTPAEPHTEPTTDLAAQPAQEPIAIVTEVAEPEPDRTVTVAAALGGVRALRPWSADFDIYIPPPLRRQLRHINDSYDYAVKMRELDPKFGRVQRFYRETVHLWNADQNNGELTRLVGTLALLAGNLETAHRYVTRAAATDDIPAQKLQAVTAAHLDDAPTACFALMRYFSATAPDADAVTWDAFLVLLDATGQRGALAELLESKKLDGAAKQVVESALIGVTRSTSPMLQPANAAPLPLAPHPAAMPAPPATEPKKPRTGTRPGEARRAAERNDPYWRAKDYELRLKNFAAAKNSYRETIRTSGHPRRESAVKDLAWLTRRTDGPDKALAVIEKEFPGVVPPGDTLDNILIHFLIGAKRYEDALELLRKQVAGTNLTTTKRYHLKRQIAYAKLASGQDSVSDWEEVVSLSPGNTAAEQGLAMALIQRGAADDLRLAEELVGRRSDKQSKDIREQIAAIREGQETDAEARALVLRVLQEDNLRLGSDTPPLVAYVQANFATQAASIREVRERDNQLVTSRDVNPLAEFARQSRDAGPRAESFIAAAVLAREIDDVDAPRYLYLGLSALAEYVSAQEQASARDLYCAALVAADEREDTRQPELQSALLGYLRLLGEQRRVVVNRRGDGTESQLSTEEVATVLLEEGQKNGWDRVFELLPQLMADTDKARTKVLDAICSRPELLAESTAYLRAVDPSWTGQNPPVMRSQWLQAGERWARERSKLSYSLAELTQIDITEEQLDSALARLRDLDGKGPAHLQEALEGLNTAIQELRRYFNEHSFEERQNCLRLADGSLRALRESIRRGPTSLVVELVEPVALRLRNLIELQESRLYATQPPKPALSLPREESSFGQSGMISVQIKVANSPGRAPIDSPELFVDVEPGLYSIGGTLPALSTIRGGDHQIVVVQLRVDERGREEGAFSLPVTLHYRPRPGYGRVAHTDSLPVRLAQESGFELIHNPFEDGATGRPVKNKDMFFGREELIAQFRQVLSNPEPGVGVAIFGQKRAGKTSIRVHLKQELEDEDRKPVADVANLGVLKPEKGPGNSTRTLALLMWMILERAEAALRPFCGPAEDVWLIPDGLTREQFIQSPLPIDDCAKLFEDYRRRMPHLPPLTVMIDEFQYIDQWIRDDILSPAFMQSLKALVERQLFHLVIVGQDALDRLIQAEPNVFGVFNAQRVTYLEDAYARKLIQDPIRIPGQPEPLDSRYREKAVDRILELTGGSAYYIQKFCNRLVQYMNAERAPVVTEADVERVRDEFLNQLDQKDFDNLESPGYTDPDAFASEHYRPVLIAIARASRSGRAATRMAIQEGYQEPRLQELLDDLVLRDVVRREEGAYRIVVRLYEDWLLKKYGATEGRIL